MKKIYLINMGILIFLLILLILFLGFLNKKLSGVPIYDKLKIDRSQLTYIKSKSSQINNEFIPKFEDLKINSQYVIKCGYQESGIYHVFYTPDMYGFQNNDNNLYLNSDIVMIGDSFGLSSCVNPPYTMKFQLEKILKKRVLNLSVQGSGPIKQMKIVAKYTANTNFDTFIWFYYEGNDWSEILESINKNLFMKEAHTPRNLFLDKNYVPSVKGINILNSQKDVMVDYKALLAYQIKFKEQKIIDYKWQNEKLVIFKIFLAEKLRGLNSLIKYFKNYPELQGYQQYDRTVNEMNIFLNNKMIEKKYIYYLPKYTRLSHKIKNHPEVKNLNKQKEMVKLIANKYDFEFIDGSEFFHNRSDPLDIFHYRLPSHYNELGYKLLAEHIGSLISK